MSGVDAEYDVTPVNKSCSNIQNTPVIIPTAGTPTAQTSANINNIQQQHVENTQYDTIDSYNVKPLHGGYNSKKSKNSKVVHEIRFLNKEYVTTCNKSVKSETVLKEFLKQNNKIYKKNHYIEINCVKYTVLKDHACKFNKYL